MKKQQKKATKELPKLSDSEEHAVTCSEERLAHEAHARAARTCREADKEAAIDGGGVAAILSKRRREKAEGELLEVAERLREAQR